MDNKIRKEKLKSSLSDMLYRIDALPVLPKNKLLQYQRYILSRLPWHITVATLSQKRVIQNFDNIVSRFVRQWLDLPVVATLSGISLPQNQTVLRSCLKSSSNETIT